MNRFEAMIMALAVDEHEGCDFNISKYSGRGMYGNETWSFQSELSATQVLGMTAGYVLGKSFEELAELIVENRYMFGECLELDEEELGESTRILADTLDGELEFVKGFRSESLGRGTVIY